MSPLHVSARARRRLVPVLVAALVSTLAVFGLTPVPAANAADTLSFVGSASTAGSRTSHTVTIPATVQAGDTLVAFLTTNSITSTLTNPAGWTVLQTKDAASSRGVAYTKKAVAADAGSPLTITSSGTAIKSTLSVAAYRSSTAGSSAVTASASAVGTTSSTSHTTPSVGVAQAGSWLVSSWSLKSSTDGITWSAPAGSTSRQTPTSTGGGLVNSLLADSNGAVATGTAAGRTATSSLAGGNDQLFSVVISPGTGGTTPPPNAAPVPSFTSSCGGRVCTFDAGATTDADNDPLTYSWNYGDATTGTGVTSSHTYATAATRTVTLTVGDGKTTAQTTRSVTTTNATPGPGHTTLVPETAHNDLPKISNGEIFDIAVVGNRVFIAGSFTSIANRRGTNTTSYARNGIASYNLTTGLVDTGFNPNVAGGTVEGVEATPDGTKLYIAGSFSTVKGVARKGIARIDLTTGAVVTAFTANTDARATEMVATNTTLYIGGRFVRVNNVARTSLAAVNATTGAVDTGFVNNLSGGVGVSGALTVQHLLLTPDQSKLVVVHTGRQINGQDRYGVGIIDVATKQLLPWRTRLWEDNLQFVGGIQRAYGAAMAPDGSYFVVSSGSGGDRPPINDTVMAFPVAGADNVQTKWISRCFDSVYSVAISEKAVYVGGHFSWNESPTAPDPWPGLDDVGYGTGQGLSGYGLGDSVVRREHLGALNPVDGKALEWSPESNSYEGNKAMLVTPRGLFTGGDATTQAGLSIGRIAFFDFNSVTAGNGVDTAITEPIQGRVEPTAQQWTAKGTAVVPSGSIARVELRVRDRDTGQYLQDDLTNWSSTSNTVNTTLQSTGARTANWSLPLTITANRRIELRAQTFSSAGTSDSTPATKKIETFGLADQPPTTRVTGPTTSPVRTMTFIVTGSATDDFGVNRVTMTIRDENNRYLQGDGTMSSTGYTFRITPDVVGAKSTTWSQEITVPYEGLWKAQTKAVDTAGQSSLDTSDGNWIVTENGQPPSVSISAPAPMVPPTAANPVTVTPGSPITFSGTANDDQQLNTVEISLRNTTTRENLASDGTWSTDVTAGWYRLSPLNLSAASYNWSYTLPAANVKPGSYTFQVRATDNLDLTTTSANQGRLTINAQVSGDNPPDTTVTPTGTILGTPTLHLDLAGAATDDKGVSAVKVSLRDNDTSKYVQPDGTLALGFATLNATLASPGATTTNWTLPVNLPQAGDYSVTAYAFDNASPSQQDVSTTGATSRYPVYPGDAPPAMNEALLAPTENTAFTDGRVFVSGRAEDDQAMQRVEIAVINAANQYLQSNGTFSTTASWRTAFLTSPGTPGSNFSYTSPVIPDGAYTLQARGVDQHDQVTAVPSVRHVTVTHPATNAPVAKFTTSCNQNVCTFDGRTSTDENAATLTYAWNYGNGTTGTGPLPTKTFTAPSTYTVSLVVTDEWGVASAPVTAQVPITEPTGNVAPTPVINAPACNGLACNFSAVGTTDPNTGDSIAYLWSFGDGTPTATTASLTHTFPAAGTYTVTLTATDGWNRGASVTRSVTVP